MNKTIIAADIPILANVRMKIVINVEGKQEAALEKSKNCHGEEGI